MEVTGMDVTKNNVLRIAPEDRKWERTGFEGVQICVMRTNDDRGASVLLKAASGAGFPAHSHPGGGELLVISGRVIVGGQVLSEGDYLWTPPGGVHDLECEEDALLFVNAPQGTKIVD